MLEFSRKKNMQIDGDIVSLTMPELRDQDEWCHLRKISHDFLVPWEPAWNMDSVSPKGFRSRIRFFHDNWKNGSSYNYFIKNRKKQLVGGIALHNIRYGACMSASIGYWTGAPFLRRGFMKEALYLILEHSFYSMSLNRVVAATMKNNIPSINLLKKFNFSPEGIAREYLCINNVWEDHVIFSLLLREHKLSKMR